MMAPIRVHFLISQLFWDLTCLRHLLFPIRMCWHTSFWTRGWELLSSWVRKLRQKPCNHRKMSRWRPSRWWDRKGLTKQQQIKTQKRTDVNECPSYDWSCLLPRRASAAHWGRGWLRRTWAPCTGCAGCSEVCGPSRPPGVRRPPFVPPDKNCTQTQVLLGASNVPPLRI